MVFSGTRRFFCSHLILAGTGWLFLFFLMAAVPARAADTSVVIYSTLPNEIWVPIRAALAKVQPEIAIAPEHIASIAGIFDRAAKEHDEGAPGADILVANDVDNWPMLSDSGRLAAFAPPSLAGLPRDSYTKDRFTFSIEPQIILYSRALVPPQLRPTGFADLARLIPPAFTGGIAGYDPFHSPFAFAVYAALARRNGDAFWAALRAIGPRMTLEMTAGKLVDGVMSGKYAVGLLVPEVFVPPDAVLERNNIALVRPADGVAMFPRSMAVLKDAPHEAAARKLIDFLLSPEGQSAIAQGGAMAYRPGYQGDGPRSFGALVREYAAALVPVTGAGQDRDRFNRTLHGALGR